jgi:hypothetical protein
MEIYSAQGAVLQNDAASALSDRALSEPIKAAQLTVYAMAGIDLPFLMADKVSALNVATGDLVLGELAAGGSLSVVSVTQQGSGGLTVSTASGDLVVLSVANGGSGVSTAALGQVMLSAAGVNSQLAINANVVANGGSITAQATGNVVNTAMLTNTTGLVHLSSTGQDVLLQNKIESQGLISVDAKRDIVMLDGQRLVSLNAADTGSISLVASRNISVSILEADGSFVLEATAGSITNGLTGNATPNLLGAGASAILRGGAGIGVGQTPLTTQIAKLAVSNSGSGGVFIQEADALDITGSHGTGQ